MRDESNRIPYAGFWVRLAAYAMDMLFVSLLLLAVRIPHWIGGIGGADSLLDRPVFFAWTAYDILLYLLQSLYFILMTRLRGATLGKSLFRLRVVSAEGRDLSWIEVIFRETAGRFLSSAVLMLGYILIIPDRDKRALHDMLSDSRVIYVHEADAYRKRKAVLQETPVPVFENFPSVSEGRPQETLLAAGEADRDPEENHAL